MPVFAPPEPATAPPYRKTFLRRHVEEQLRTRSVDVLALTEIERRLLDRFPDACHERLGRRGTPREGDAFRDWLRDGPLSLEAFFLGRDPISGGFPDLDVYRPVPVFDFGQHRSGDWPDLSTLLFELARQGDERGVVLRARGGAGKTVGQVKAFCDCAWGAERGVDPTKTLAGQRHVPCWLDPGDVPDRDTDLIEHMLLRQSNLEDRLDVETLKLWLKFDHPRPLLFCDLNAASEEGNPSDRLRLARGLVRYQKEHGRRGHRCVVAYRSARRDDAVLNQLGHLFRAVDLRPLGLDDAERYLRAFREFEARVVERVRKPPEQGGLGLPLPRSEHDIEAEVARLRELVRRYATAPVVSEDRDAAADDEAAPEALISTPLLMHFVSLLSGKELDGVKTITDLYRSVVERHVERDVTKYSTLQDCLELRETDSARPRLMAAMTRVALAIRQKGPGSTRLPHDELVDLLTHPGPRAKPREVAALTGNAEFWSSEASEYHWLEPMNSPESYRRALLDFSLLRSDGRSHGFLHDSLIDFFQGLAIRYHEGARRPLLVGEDWARAVVNRVAADPRGHRRGLEFLGGALGPEEARELLLEFALVHPVPADWPDLLRRLSGGAAGRSQVAHAIHEMMVRLGTTVCRLPDSMASQFHACLKDHPASPVVSFAASLADRLTASRRPWLRLRLGRVHSTHVVLEGHGARVNAVAALGDGRVVSGSEDGTVRVWNLSTGDATVLAGHGGSVRGVAAWGHHGVVSGSDDGTVRLWNLSTGDARVLKWPGDSVWGVAALGDGRVVSGLDDGTVRVWDPESEVVTVLRGHGRPVNALSVLTDGRVVSGSDDGTVRVWNLETGDATVLRGHGIWVSAVAALGYGRVVSGSGDGTVRVWNLETGDATVLEGHDRPVRSVAALEDGRVVSGSEDGTVRIWNLETGAATVLKEHDGWVRSVAALGDGRVVSGSEDRTVRVWDLTSHDDTILVGHRASVNAVLALRDGRVVSGSSDHTVRIWDFTNKSAIVLKGHDDWVRAVAELGDGRVVSGSDDGTVRVWNVDHKSAIVLEASRGKVRAVAALGDGRVVSGSEDGTVRVWNLETKDATVLWEHFFTVRSLAALGDGRVASGSEDGIVRVWNLATKDVTVLWGHRYWVNALSVLIDGRVISGSDDGTVRILDLTTEVASVLKGHGGKVRAVAALGAGRVVSGSWDRTIRVWDADRGQVIEGLSFAMTNRVMSVGADPVRHRVVAGLRDGRVLVWDVMPEAGDRPTNDPGEE